MLADYHMHSLPWSPDAHDRPLDMALAALARGMTHICFTDHVENCSQEPDFPDQFPPTSDWEGLAREIHAVRDALSGRLDVRLGAEVGSPHYLPEEAARIYARPELDFIIGSVHNLRRRMDFYFLDYPDSFDEFRPTVEEYLDEYIALAGSGLCDVLGHIGYMQRYMARQGKCFDMMLLEDRLRDLFTVCVDCGVGIEVNTSGLSDDLAGFIPQPEVLRLYRSLGGELVTVGSDAHTTANAGAGIAEGYELLRSLGFRYVCLYRAHTPEPVRL